MKIIVAIAFVLMSMSVNAQNIPVKYTTSKDAENGEVVFKGLISFDDLIGESTFDWFKKGIEAYQPNTPDVAILNQTLSKYTIVVVMGTWCDDSHNLVPKLYRVINAAQFPLSQFTIYGADRAKTIGNGAEKTYNITLVPTIIVFDGTKEIGRITESVQKSVEADLVAIVQKYKKG